MVSNESLSLFLSLFLYLFLTSFYRFSLLLPYLFPFFFIFFVLSLLCLPCIHSFLLSFCLLFPFFSSLLHTITVLDVRFSYLGPQTGYPGIRGYPQPLQPKAGTGGLPEPVASTSIPTCCSLIILPSHEPQNRR